MRLGSVDVLIIGGGIVGLTLALEVARREPGSRVCVLDKELDFGAHASGRNSGVLHAGFYYSEDSLKARFCVEGNQAWKDFCAAHDLPVNPAGKLVVARTPDEVPVLRTLLARGLANGVALSWVDEAEARALEPRVKTVEGALWSPSTATIDPGRIVARVALRCAEAGVQLRPGVRWLGREGTAHRTSEGVIEAGFVINAAGLHADLVARSWGVGERYRIVPFKGLYLYAEPEEVVRRAIYPVPLAGNAFLGVHYTPTVDGHTKIGPTAVPALWREHYGGVDNFVFSELAEVLRTQAQLLRHSDFGFRKLAIDELRKQSRARMVALAGALVEDVRPEHYRRWGRPGLRAQLVDLERGALVSDFVVERGEQSLHVLNAVSPAFTCALPFARACWDLATGTAGALDGRQ